MEVVRASSSSSVLEQLEIEALSVQGTVDTSDTEVYIDSDVFKPVVSMIFAALNAVDCSNAPSCFDINRTECGKGAIVVDNTCGACLQGFMGTSGSSNDPCSMKSELVDISTENVTKSCPGGCSGHGYCQYMHLVSWDIAQTCLAGDTSCIAYCVCDSYTSGSDGISMTYRGLGCESTQDDFERKIALRETALGYLYEIIQVEDPSTQGVMDWIQGVAEASRTPLELSSDSQDLILEVPLSSSCQFLSVLCLFAYNSVIFMHIHSNV